MVEISGPLLCCLLLLIWLLASLATWKERLFGFLGIAAGLALTLLIVDPSMKGPATTSLTNPTGFLGFAVMAVLLAKRPPLVRTSAALACAK